MFWWQRGGQRAVLLAAGCSRKEFQAVFGAVDTALRYHFELPPSPRWVN